MTENINQINRNYTKKQIAEELLQLRNQVRQEEGQDPNIIAAAGRAGQEAISNVTGLSPEEMAASMTALGVSVNNTLQQVTGKIIDGRNTLADLDRACVAKKDALEELFGQEVIARSIGNALADHDTKKKEFAIKEAELVEGVARQELVNHRNQQEWQAKFSKDCAQVKADFNYDFSQEQRTQRDAFADALKNERITFDDEQRVAQRTADETEANLKNRVEIVTEQEKAIEGIEEKVKAQVSKEKHTALSAITKQHEHETAIALTQADTAAQISASTIVANGEMIKKQQTEIEQLKTALAASQTEVGSIANKALESAAGRLALDSVLTQDANGGGTTRPRKN